MKISAIMTNYNGGQYIGEAIRSVLEQDYDNFELIIVDDGSTDNSTEIINRTCQNHESRVSKFFVKKNQGQAGSMNHAIQNMTGEVASFLDSDDLWLPGKLASVSNIFSTNRDVAIYQHNLFKMKNGQITDEKIRDILVQGDYFAHTRTTRLLPQFVPTSGLSIRADCLGKVVPIPVEFRVSADGYLTRTSFCWGQVISNPDGLGVYRIHDTNNTYGNNSYNEQRYLEKLLYPALDRYYLDNNIDLSFKKSVLQKILDTSLSRILQQYIKTGI